MAKVTKTVTTRKSKNVGVSGVAVAMIGTGALAIYSAIQDKSPLEVLRSILAGERPESLGTSSRGSRLSGGSALETGTYQGTGKVTSKAGLQPHVAAEAEFIANTWRVEVQGFVMRNIAGTNTLSDHARGLALDAMMPNNGKGVQAQNIGDAIFTHYRLNAKTKRVKYIIWQHTIWSPERGARRYGKNDHMNHDHISFYGLGSSRAI